MILNKHSVAWCVSLSTAFLAQLSCQSFAASSAAAPVDAVPSASSAGADGTVAPSNRWDAYSKSGDPGGVVRVNDPMRPDAPDGGKAAYCLMNAQYDDAIKYATMALVKEPHNGVLFQVRSEAYSALGQNDKALADINQAIQYREEGDWKPYQLRGKIYSKMGQPEKTIEDLTLYISKMNDAGLPWDALLSRAYAYIDVSRFDDAIADANAAKAYDLFSGSFALGKALHLKGNLKDALEAYGVAIQTYPQSAEALCNRALVYEDLNRHDFAKIDLDNAIKGKPDFDYAYASLAEVNYVLGNYDDAIAAGNKAIELNANNAYAYAQIACSLGEQQKHADALKAAEKSVAIEPRDTFLNVLGAAQMHNSKVPDAIQSYTRSLAIKKSEDAFEKRAMCYCIVGDYAKAIADYDSALALRPGDGHFLGERALANSLAGNAEASRKDAAAALDALLKCAHSSSSLVLDDAKNELPPSVRIKYLERAIKTNDGLEDGRLRLMLSSEHKKLGQMQQSNDDLKSAAELGFSPAK